MSRGGGIAMINYFKAAERTLSERGNLERALDNLSRRREAAASRGMIQGGAGAVAYASGGRTNNDLADLLELAELDREIATTRSVIEEIDRVLAQLDKGNSDLLRAWYIERKSKEEIAAALHYSSSSTLYELRNKAVAAFAILYYGAGALASV